MRMYFILDIFLNSKEIFTYFILFGVILKNVFRNTFLAILKMIIEFLLLIINTMDYRNR